MDKKVPNKNNNIKKFRFRPGYFAYKQIRRIFTDWNLEHYIDLMEYWMTNMLTSTIELLEDNDLIKTSVNTDGEIQLVYDLSEIKPIIDKMFDRNFNGYLKKELVYTTEAEYLKDIKYFKEFFYNVFTRYLAGEKDFRKIAKDMNIRYMRLLHLTRMLGSNYLPPFAYFFDTQKFLGLSYKDKNMTLDELLEC